MSRQTEAFLQGRVEIASLEAHPDAQGRFRGSDARGEVAKILSGPDAQHVEYIGFAEAGVVRGNHCHEAYRETLYVVSGQLRLILGDRATGERAEITLMPGMIATLAPGIAHALVALSEAAAISLGTGSDPFVDRVPYKLV